MEHTTERVMDMERATQVARDHIEKLNRTLKSLLVGMLIIAGVTCMLVALEVVVYVFGDRSQASESAHVSVAAIDTLVMRIGLIGVLTAMLYAIFRIYRHTLDEIRYWTSEILVVDLAVAATLLADDCDPESFKAKCLWRFLEMKRPLYTDSSNQNDSELLAAEGRLVESLLRSIKAMDQKNKKSGSQAKADATN